MKHRTISLLLALTMVITLFSGLTFSANAESITTISESCDITEDGTYQLAESLSAADLTIAEGVKEVTILGNGAQWNKDISDAEQFGRVTSAANCDILIDCSDAPGIKLTLQDLYIDNNYVGHNTVDFSGEGNQLIFDGTVIIDHDNNIQGFAGIHVAKGTELTIYGTSGSSFYMYKREQAAGIGANNRESCGTINFGTEGGANDFYFFMKGTKQGAVIGNGANCSETPGDITFYAGIYNLVANVRGSLIGGSAGPSSFAAGNVYIKGGLLNLNVDYTGAAIGGGGYESGNDKGGGNVYMLGGSVRTYIDTNAASLWSDKGVTEAGVNDVAITAKKLDADGNDVSLLQIDTTEIPADDDGNYTVVVDGKTHYSGPLYSYCFCYESVDRDESNAVYPNGTPGNWIALESENNLYIYLTEGTHHVLVNEVELYGHAYAENGFCAYCDIYNPDAECYCVSTAAQLAAIADAVNGGDTLAGKTVTLANDVSLADFENWTPIGGATTKVALELASAEDLTAALEEHFIVYDSTGASYVRASEKNGTYDPNRTYYYLLGAAFSGTFDGGNHSISALQVDTDSGYAGLFGNVNGTVKNLTVSGSVTTTTTADYVGGIAGKLSAGGLLENCSSDVTVTANTAYNIGGVVGFVGEPGAMVSESNPIATVRNCVNNGSVSGYVRTGGIAGRNAGKITGSINYGTIFNVSGAKKGTGGITGMNGVNNAATDAGIVEFCYNDGYVNSNSGYWGGGIVGFQNAVSSCTNSYNAGKLKTAASATGTKWSWINPIVGQNEGTVKACLWLNEDTADNTANYIGKDTTGVGNQGKVENTNGMTSTALKSADAIASLNGTATQGFQSDCNRYPALYWQAVTAHTPETDEAVAATCTEAGLTEGSHCSVCGDPIVAQQEIPALGHRYTKTVVAPTCEVEGYTQYLCTVCGSSYREDFVPALGHNYTKTVVAATCTTEGYTQYTCTRCEETHRAEYTAALGHAWTHTVKAATCDKMGYTTHTCSRCSHSYIDSFTDALEHDYAQKITKDPTCTETGEMSFYCDSCGASYTQVLPKTAHETEEITIQAGCESYGYVTVQCKHCDYSYVSKIFQPTGHNGVLCNEAEATCTEDGYTGDTVCTYCHETLAVGSVISASCPSARFADISRTAWYHTAIDYVVTHELMAGVASDCFAPDENLTRSMLVTMLYRLAGAPDTSAMENPFADVAENSWYADAVIWGAHTGVVAGIRADAFDPEAPVTREQMVSMLHRYAKMSEGDLSATADLSAFTDAQSVSTYAAEAMQWAVGSGIVSGIGDNQLDPAGTATRAQIATIFMHYLNKVV